MIRGFTNLCESVLIIVVLVTGEHFVADLVLTLVSKVIDCTGLFVVLEMAATELGHLPSSFSFESAKHSEASVGEEEED